MTVAKQTPVFICILSCSVSTQAVAQSAARDEIEALRTELAQLSERVAQLEGELARTQNTTAPATAQPVTEIQFEGAPELSTSDGWSFKPRGRANFDFGFVSAPESTGADSGFDAKARRIRLGVAGDIPGGFGYRIEADFAGNNAVLFDAIITYENDGLTLTVGQHNTFQGLEELSSALDTSFIERAAFTDAFNFERRVGVSAAYQTDTFLVQAGVFTDNSVDLPSDNSSVDARMVFAPSIGDTRLHLGASVHYNDLSDNGSVRYRQRPLVNLTDNRFINTGQFSATSELGLGFEAAVISGPFHFAAETFLQSVDRPDLLADPNFLGASAEIGMFLTEGDSRSYQIGTFGRVRPERPVGENGIGALQINLRYDYLDLSSAGIFGGTQDSIQASLVWTLTNHTKLLFNYGLMSYNNAAFSAAAEHTSYDVHVAGIRAQIDF